MMGDSKRDIGLLGGSFNPVHKGHLAIAESFLASEYISELWILLTPSPPHKTDKSLNDYEHRLAMLKVAFQNVEGVTISDVENRLPRPSYTIQTLEHVTDEQPDYRFYLCLGEDSLRDFKQWKSWQRILTFCELLVARRSSDEPLDLDPDLAPNTHFVSHTPVDVSSTQIRELAAGGEDISAFVPAGVGEIIQKENLYKQS